MTKYEYDDAASRNLQIDVVHEVPEATPRSASNWVEAARRLNTIEDRLARDLLELHQDCGTGNGECDSGEEFYEQLHSWGCETTARIAHHFNVEYPHA